MGMTSEYSSCLSRCQSGTMLVFSKRLQFPACGERKPVLESERKVPAGCCVLGGQRTATLARWVVAVSLGCCAERNPAAKPQVHLLPGPLHCSCGRADPEARAIFWRYYKPLPVSPELPMS